MGSSKNANFVAGAFGGESFKARKLYKDAESDTKPDRSFAQPSPDAKKIKPKKEAVTASEKANALKENEVSIKEEDKKPFVSKSVSKRQKNQKRGRPKKKKVEEEAEEETEEEQEN